METGYGGSKLKRKLLDYNAFSEAIQKEELVFLFGTGISSALTGKPYSWGKWISDGIDGLREIGDTYANEKYMFDIRRDYYQLFKLPG